MPRLPLAAPRRRERAPRGEWDGAVIWVGHANVLDAKTALRRLAEYAYARLERERPRVIAQRSHRGKERTLRVLRSSQLLDS
eukprot:scaffold61491_cov61-Phaeocystis_antarctica.AAC.3